MSVTRRIYVSLTADRWLPKSMNDLKWAIVDEIENLGYTPEIFTNPRGKPGLASSRAWGARDADEVARRCMGAAIIGMARWEFKDSNGKDARLPTEFNHYEGALARTLGLPTLVLVQQDVMRRVVFDPTYGGFVGEIPAANADTSPTDPLKACRDASEDRARRVAYGVSKRRRNTGEGRPELAEDRGISGSIWLLEGTALRETRCFLGLLQQLPGNGGKFEILSAKHWSDCSRLAN